MRLDASQQHLIVEEARRVFGPDVTVRLFGSRVDDNLRGGDIDLHLEAVGTPGELLDKELQLHARLLRRLGQRRIDIVVHRAGSQYRPVDEQAHAHGLVL